MKVWSPVTLAIISLIVGNLMASLSDVAVKLLEGDVFAFQYIFIRQCIATLLVAPFYVRQHGNFSTKGLNWPITAVRANLIIIGAACMVVAITHLPLATANAIFYAAPLIMLPLSWFILKEKATTNRIVASMIGFVGVLIVLRPSQFHWAASFAVGTAITIALFSVLVRKLPSEHNVLHTLFWTSLFSLPISGGLALFSWQALEWSQLGWIVLSSVSVLIYNGLSVFAYKKAPANQIALSEYTGLIFVTLFGVWWFDEVPDLLTVFGISMIILPLLPLKRLRAKTRINMNNER